MNSAPTRTPTGARRTKLIGAVLVLATLCVYWQTRAFLFTNYDDPFFIYENPIVTAGLTLRGVLWAFSTTYFDFWHPLTWLSHMAACDLFGPRAGLHHLVNVALHIASALLLFGALTRMTGALKRSALVAGLFALHPLHVESVAWLAERKDALSGVFFMLTLWAYVRYAQADAAERSGDVRAEGKPGAAGSVRGSTFWYRVAVVSFALGLMSKAIIVTLAFVLLLLDFWPLRRLKTPLINTGLQPGASMEDAPSAVSTASRESGETAEAVPQAHSPTLTRLKLGVNESALLLQQRPLAALLREKIPFFALTLASCLITYLGMRTGQNVLSEKAVPFGFRLANAAVSYAEYIEKFFWPAKLAPMYPLPTHLGFLPVLGAVALLLIATVVLVRNARTLPYATVGWFWFMGMLVPVIGIVAMSNAAMADRYMYLPAIGLSIALVWAGADVLRRCRLPVVLGQAVALISLAALGYVSWHQAGYWHDSIALWRHCLAVTPNNVVAHYNLGWALEHSGQPKEALVEYRKAVELKPDHLDATMNIGTCYMELKRFDTATNWLGKALELRPDYWTAQQNMGVALVELGDFRAARTHLREALKVNPQSPGALTALGRICSAEGNSEEAVQNYTEAIRINPRSPDAYYYLGLESLKNNSPDQAQEYFKEAVTINPLWDLAHLQYAITLGAAGSPKAAIQEYQAALRLNPDLVPALNNLAWVLATHRDPACRDGAEAVRLARRACEVTHHREPVFVGTLAAAYAEAGQFEQAIEMGRQACELARSLGQTNILGRNEDLLKLYQSHRPCRDK